MKLHLLFSLLKKHTFFIILLLISVSLFPLTLYLLNRSEPLFKIQQAAPEANLQLHPRNIAISPEGNWQFTEGQEVTIDLILESNIHEVETVDARIFYDPQVLTLTNSENSVHCSELTILDNTIFHSIAGITQNEDGSYSGSEVGNASITCSAVDQQSTQDYTPLPASFAGTIAQFTFLVKETADNSQIRIDFSPTSPRNDSNILEYEGACCSTTDVLNSVENLTFDAVSNESTASLALSPSTNDVVRNQPFDVSINLSTGPYEVDGVDVVLSYDASQLRATNVRQSTLFDQYVSTPSPSGIEETGSEGIISISGLINPGSTEGVVGDNLLVATVTFQPIALSGVASVSFVTEATGGRNDTNISEFITGTDILTFTLPGSYTIRSGPATPTPPIIEPEIRLQPGTGTFPAQVPIDVDVYVSTAGEPIDSVDATINYDPEVFSLMGVEPGNRFDTHTFAPEVSEIESANGTMQISGVIDPDSQAVTGNNILLATLTLMPHHNSPDTTITISFEGIGVRNDSNIVRYKEAVDILRSVVNASYSISGTGDNIIESILFRISLQGRDEALTPKARDLSIRFLNTHFDTNRISRRSSNIGEVSLTHTDLQNRLRIGTYDVLIKPNGYLQRRFNISALSINSVIDITDRPFYGGDLNNSGKINGLDWGIYINHFNSEEDELADLDGSGKVTGLDNAFLIINWNKLDEN